MDFTLALVRHGESEANVRHMLSGWLDVDLTAHGIAELEERVEEQTALIKSLNHKHKKKESKDEGKDKEKDKHHHHRRNTSMDGSPDE